MSLVSFVRYLNVAVSVVLLIVVAFYAHRRIQHEYYAHCVGDIIQVLFFKNSSFCILMSNVNDIIEASFVHAMAHVQEIFMQALKS
jgi:hypothetical protein